MEEKKGKKPKLLIYVVVFAVISLLLGSLLADFF